MNNENCAERVFDHFREIAKIPHGSGNTKAISDHLAAFAKREGLSYLQDALGNVIVKKPASQGYEGKAPVILQGHMDMVAEKTPDCKKDMTKEGLDLVFDGDTLYAKDTTLGGDDGVAVCFMLALLEDKTAKHPPLECVFTVDEETGLLGAKGLDASFLQGKRMLNIDCAREGSFIAGCAGGVRVDLRLPIAREAFCGTVCHLNISGLKGGHSGEDINCGRENANKLGAEFLSKLDGVRVISLSGGNADNAIPRVFDAYFALAGDAPAKIVEATDQIVKKYRTNEPDIAVFCEPSDSGALPLDDTSTKAFLGLLSAEPNGVQEMSEDCPGLVETSLNLGILRTEEDAAKITFSLRSSDTDKKNALFARVSAIGERFGAEALAHSDYPGWKYAKNSPLRDKITEVYKELSGKDAEVCVIHAGLECGIFSGKIPGLDCISFGPDLYDIHTTKERLSISSVGRTYALIRTTLERL